MTENNNGSLLVGDVLVEPALDQISRDSRIINLRPQVMELLVFLASHNGQVVSVQELLNKLWTGKVVTDGTLYNCIAELRHCITRLDDTQSYIETIPKKGYRLSAAVAKPRKSPVSPEAESNTVPTIDSGAGRNRRSMPVWVLLLVLFATLAMLIKPYLPFSEPGYSTPVDRPVKRFTIELPRDMLGFDLHIQHRPVTISPDGRHVIFNGIVEQQAQLYSRSIDSLEVVPIKGTEHAASVIAISPDGLWIAFVDQNDGRLKKVPAIGGVPITLCDPKGRVWGLSWGRNQLLVFESSTHNGLMRVSSQGGKPEPITFPAKGSVHKQPSVVPGGSAVLFTIGERGSTIRKTDTLAVVSLETGEQKTLIPGAAPKATSNGVLIYYRENALWAVLLEADRLGIRGDSVPVADDVLYDTDAHYSIADDGTLVYVIDTNLMRRELVWVDRMGNEEALPFGPMPFVSPRIAPSGDHIAVVVDSVDGADLWMYSLQQATRTRLTHDESREAAPVWSRDGNTIFYSSDRIDNLYRVSTDGRGTIEKLTSSSNYQFAYSTTPNDRQLLFSQGPGNILPSELVAFDLAGKTSTELIPDKQFSQFDPAISPDGNWLAYSSTRSGRAEVYVRAYPGVDGAKWPVSVGGGTQPLWGPTGEELFYWGPTGLMVVPIKTTAPFRMGRVKVVISLQNFVYYDMRNFDLSPDGKRFLLVKKWLKSDKPANRIVLAQNWVESVERKVRAQF